MLENPVAFFGVHLSSGVDCMVLQPLGSANFLSANLSYCRNSLTLCVLYNLFISLELLVYVYDFYM